MDGTIDYSAVERLVDEIRVQSCQDDVREIPGFDGYFVTPNGQIWCIRGRGRQLLAKHPRRRKTRLYKGFELVTLSVDNELTTISTFRALALAFVGPEPDENSQASPIDGNRRNTSASNVHWTTQSVEMNKYIAEHGPLANGERQHMAKAKDAQIPEMRRLYASGISAKEIAARFGMSARSVRRLVRGQSWKHVEGELPAAHTHVRGIDVGLAKLTEDKVKEIRKLHSEGVSGSELARQFQVGTTAISQVVRHNTWRHVE